MDIVIIDGLSFALPLFIMAIGGIYCEKSGVTMLAVEGLQGFGAFIGAFVAVAIAGNFAGDSLAPFYIAMVMAAVGGSLFALIHAMLCLKFKANQVISGVVVNILAMALTAYLTKLFNRVVFGATSDKFVLTVSSRITIPGISKIPVLGAVFTNLYPFELVIVVVAFVAWFVMYKTRFGMHLRACGDNPHAVDAAGRQVGQIRLAAIMICGALSGLGGICFAYSISANFSSSIYVGYGYLAIAALIFGNWRGTDLRQLAYPADSGSVSVVRICQIRWIPSGTGTADAQQLSGSGHDPALCTDSAASGILLQTERCTESTGSDLRQRCKISRHLQNVALHGSEELLQKKRKRKAFSFLIHI